MGQTEVRMTYDLLALRLSAKRREKNILAFKETIKKEQESIEYFQYIITQIDTDHPDVKKLRGAIKKKRANINIFKRAIKDEKIMIKQELKMASLTS